LYLFIQESVGFPNTFCLISEGSTPSIFSTFGFIIVPEKRTLKEANSLPSVISSTTEVILLSTFD